MPLYEYICNDCEVRFEQLQPVSRMNDPASCPAGHASGRRVPSIFAALSRDGDGETTAVGGGGCGGCGGGCANCACSVN